MARAQGFDGLPPPCACVEGAERSSYPLGVEGGAEEAYLMCVKRDVGNL